MCRFPSLNLETLRVMSVQTVRFWNRGQQTYAVYKILDLQKSQLE